MTIAPRHHRCTFREYLALEAFSTVRHEFLLGEIYAMAGGTPQHAALAMSVGAVLVAKLRGARRGGSVWITAVDSALSVDEIYGVAEAG